MGLLPKKFEMIDIVCDNFQRDLTVFIPKKMATDRKSSNNDEMKSLSVIETPAFDQS